MPLHDIHRLPTFSRYPCSGLYVFTLYYVPPAIGSVSLDLIGGFSYVRTNVVKSEWSYLAVFVNLVHNKSAHTFEEHLQKVDQYLEEIEKLKMPVHTVAVPWLLASKAVLDFQHSMTQLLQHFRGMSFCNIL